MGRDLDREQWSRLAELRTAATPWRIRGEIDGEPVIDSSAAVLVWEPRRVTPVYAVPLGDVTGELVDAEPAPSTAMFERRPVLDPSVPFTVHTAPGRAMTLRTPKGPVAVFAADDPVVGERLLVDFDALDWFEEADPVVAHPRDPFHRIDVHAATRHLVLTLDGVTVVDTARPRMLAETGLPVRWYVPREDVLVPLHDSSTVTWCAYKGRATYVSAQVGDALVPDIAWTYVEPLRDATDVRGLLGFSAERMDGAVDGVPLPRRGMGPPA